MRELVLLIERQKWVEILQRRCLSLALLLLLLESWKEFASLSLLMRCLDQYSLTEREGDYKDTFG